MLVSDFDYYLPPERIAQSPVESRHHSRLLVADRRRGTMDDRHFFDLPELLNPGDLLILNDSRVIPARLYGRKLDSRDGAFPGDGSAAPRIELFLLRELPTGEWECLTKPGKKAKPGSSLQFAGGVVGEISVGSHGSRKVRFSGTSDFHSWLAEHGETPLAPFIHERLADRERYQTVYAKQEGSVAAPTAGLHFTPEVFAKLRDRGIATGFLTLHVGLATFRPVQVDKVEDHVMHPELFTLPEELVQKVMATQKNGGKIVAVGTTTVRVLESQADENGHLIPGSGETAIFIYPPYRFKVVDALVTNFHLPKSTLLMLVSAFAGREFMLECYQHAVRENYRFFSFGDAMLIQ